MTGEEVSSSNLQLLTSRIRLPDPNRDRLRIHRRGGAVERTKRFTLVVLKF